MNKIYKVIWSKVKHQYVVVSELAHSNGKQSRTSRNSIRSRIAALVVCGAIAAFGVFSALPNSVYAAEAGGTTVSAQYIAIKVDTNNNSDKNSRTFSLDGKNYTYTKQNLGTRWSPEYYWVREGYTAEIEHNKRFDGAQTDVIVKVYKNDNASDDGLLQSYQTVSSKGNITTSTGYNIQDSNTGVYGGAVNTGGTSTPSSYAYNVDFNGTGNYSHANLSKNFKNVTLENGVYKYNGQAIAPNNIYVIDGKLGVFVDNYDNVYTGNVYGDNNEVLMTAVGDDNNLYSYWGAEIDDPNATMGSMTVSQYNADRKELKDDIKGVHGEDIKEIKVSGVKNEGKIAFGRYGQYDATTDSYTGEYDVPGTITVTSTGGTEGKDVSIQFANDQGSFTVDAGSKVEATKFDENEKVSELSINGETYAIGGGETYTAGNGIAIDDEKDNEISVRLKDDETNLTVDDTGLALNKDLTVDSVNAGGTIINSTGLTAGNVKVNAENATVTGLSNTTWDTEIASAVEANKNGEAGYAATQGQLKDVADMAGSAAEEAGKHTTVKKGDNNLVITSGVNEAGGSEYTISLNDNILLGDMNTSGVMINGTNGTIAVTNGFTVGSTTVNDGKIIGLANVDWSPEQTRTDEDLYDASQGATQGQLDDLYSSVVGYDINEDGTINYNSITLGNGSATEYKGKDGGGVRLTNVAYAGNITDSAGNVVGSAAVNVDYLNDTIKNSASGGEIAENEKHLATNVGETADRAGVTYAPDDTGKVTIEEVNGNGEFTGNSVVISDVASKQELDSVKDNIGDMDFSDTNYIKGDTNLTDAVVDLDDAIKDTNDRIDGLGDKIDEVSNSSITGGKINEDTGKIDLIKNDGTAVTMEGQLSDSILDTVDDSKLKSDGEIILTSHDKYDPNKTESVTLNDIASKTNLDNLSSTVGATTTEELKESYKDTAYINDADTMVDADVKLDQAVQNVASTSYANDMYLNERINNVESRLGDVEERIDKVGAMAAAIANLRTMGYDPEAPTEIAVGVGQYKSETGIAIGVFHYPNQDFMLSASLSSSGDELMGGIGATWKLGRKSAAERAKDEEARHLEQAEEMKKLAQQEKVKAQAQRHAKLLAERQQASQKNA